MPKKRIIELQEESKVSEGMYVVTDHATKGTKKLPLSVLGITVSDPNDDGNVIITKWAEGDL